MSRHYTFEEKGEIRTAYDAGITAIGVPDGIVHPECRTDEEMMWTVRFYKSGDRAVQGKNCVRCDDPLSEIPVHSYENQDNDDDKAYGS